MAFRRLHPDQPDGFAFAGQNRQWADGQIAKYPEGREASAIIPLLWRAQDQHDGWLPRPAIEHVADMLDMPYIRALEVATFYSKFNLAPVGEFFVQVCGTTPCMLRGSDDILKACKERIGPERTATADGKFSWLEVECLGACCNAPMVQINDDYYEDLDEENFIRLLDNLAAGKAVKTGSQTGRVSSEPVGVLTTLTDATLYDGTAPVRATGNGNGASRTVRTPSSAASVSAPEAAAPARSALESVSAPEPIVAETVAAKPVDASSSDGGNRPEALDEPRGGVADDLKRIKGIGPKIEGILNELGVYHFDQIAGWGQAQIDWVDDYLSFKGRIERDAWGRQAGELAVGED